MGIDIADFYDSIPEPFFSFPVLVAFIFLALPTAAFIGFFIGHHERMRLGYDKVPSEKIPGGTSLGATLALLGLLLGFAFSSSVNWREARQTALVEEAAAIGSAFLSADLLETANRDKLQNAILAYAKTRLAKREDISSKRATEAFLERTRQAQSQIWPTTLQALNGVSPEPVRALVAQRVMDVLDAHTRRIAAAAEHIPEPAQFMIVFIMLIAILVVGNRSALQGRPLTWRTFLFAGVLAIVMLVVFDLDRPLEGTMRLNPYPMLEVIEDIEAALAERS